jgi:hypothetical protein
MRTPTAAGAANASLNGSKGPREQAEYLSYLIRLWQVDTAVGGHRVDGTGWRGSLESSLTGERHGFASLDELFEFLQSQMGGMADVDEEQSREDKYGCP